MALRPEQEHSNANEAQMAASSTETLRSFIGKTIVMSGIDQCQ
jgi:hypothetical protein